MSENTQGAEEDPLDETADAAASGAEPTTDAVGLTSDEIGDDKKSLLQTMTVYDSMLMVSLFCIGLATLLLLFELRTFGDFPSSFPWRTNEF